MTVCSRGAREGNGLNPGTSEAMLQVSGVIRGIMGYRLNKVIEANEREEGGGDAVLRIVQKGLWGTLRGSCEKGKGAPLKTIFERVNS